MPGVLISFRSDCKVNGMAKFTTQIKQFGEQGEKTGWTYIQVPVDIAQEIFPENKKAFRVKGKLDQLSIKAVALMPMGDGSFIMPLNATMRKDIRKRKGAMIEVQIIVDKVPLTPTPEFLACLEDEPKAKEFFYQLKNSHRNYYIKWLSAVKGDDAIAKRMAQAIDALSNGLDFAGMYHSLKAAREKRR